MKFRGAKAGKGDRGFTLAEVMAALVFMAILIPVAMEGLSLASRVGEVAARKTDAALVADRLINEALVTTNWSRAVESGTTRQGIVDYQWTLRSEPWTTDLGQNAMRLLTAEVIFKVKGQEQKVSLSTLVDDYTPFLQTNSL